MAVFHENGTWTVKVRTKKEALRHMTKLVLFGKQSNGTAHTHHCHAPYGQYHVFNKLKVNATVILEHLFSVHVN